MRTKCLIRPNRPIGPIVPIVPIVPIPPIFPILSGIISNTRATEGHGVEGVRLRESKKIGASREGSSDLLSGPKTYDVIRMEEHHCKHRYTCYRPRVSS